MVRNNEDNRTSIVLICLPKIFEERSCPNKAADEHENSDVAEEAAEKNLEVSEN